jgi:hypothetical protein
MPSRSWEPKLLISLVRRSSPDIMNLPPKSKISRKIDRERGQSATEFVLIFPALLLFVFLIVDFGWLFKNYIVVTNAGREAARCAAVDNCKLEGADVTATEMAIQRIKSGGAIHSGDTVLTDVHWIDEDGDGQPGKGDSIVFCLQSPSRWVTPLLAFASMVGIVPNGNMPLKARTEMRLEKPYTGGDLGAEGDTACAPS